MKCWGAQVLGCLLVGSAMFVLPATAAAQAGDAGDRIVAAVRAAMVPALPFPETDHTGSVPADHSPEPAWMVRSVAAGERSIEVMANPLNQVNQARAVRAMAQIGAAVDAAQRRAEAQYERAVAEAKRTGRSQDVDGVGLSDEGVAGARIDAEAHVTIDVDFNQPSYTTTIETAVAPAASRQVVIAGALAVITVPSNVFQVSTAGRTDERFCQSETIVYFGALAAPDVRKRADHQFEVVAAAADSVAAVKSLALRFRGNEILIAEILRKTDWTQVQALLH